MSVAVLFVASGCRSDPSADEAPAPVLSFESIVVSDTANLWWARVPVDVNGDGQVDLALQSNNGHGGWLGWFESGDSARSWTAHVIAESAPDGDPFAAGDLDAMDIDGDGDMDVLAMSHPGEWDEATTPSHLYWYESSADGWIPHGIGSAPDFVKDADLVDFDRDGDADVVVITFEEHSLTVFRQNGPDDWVAVLQTKLDSLHEGMDVEDLDGDGDVDIATNGYWVENPGGDLTGEWMIRSIDDRWHNQQGDWSRNATKVATGDIDGDGQADVVMAHSERTGYPLAWYGSVDPIGGAWTMNVLAENWPAGHTLQVFDADLDGDNDVLAGMNRGRAKALGETSFPVVIFLNEGAGMAWTRFALTDGGIYNGQVADFDGDGDVDILRLPSHDAATLEVLVNQLRQ